MTIKADVEVLKTQIATIKSSFDDHVTQNREDFKEVHSRMSTMKREISDEINLTFEKLCDKIDINEKQLINELKTNSLYKKHFENKNLLN